MPVITGGSIFIPCMSIRIDPKNIAVVMPAYNEHTIIVQVIRELLTFKYSIVVVDDGSDTPLAFLAKEFPVTVLTHPVNLGQGASLQTGIEYALSQNATYIITFDADGQHQAADIEKLVQPLLTDEADIVLGSRFMEGSQHNMTAGRKILIRIARVLNYFLTGLLLTDAHNGIRALNRKAAAAIHITENRMAHATQLLSSIRKNNLRYKELPVTIRYTAYSLKKGQTLWSSFRIFFDILLSKIFK